MIMMTDLSSALPRIEQRPCKHYEYLGDDNDADFNHGSLNGHMIIDQLLIGSFEKTRQ